MKSYWAAAVVAITMSWAGASFAVDRGPNYDCANRMKQCVKGCDDDAEKSHNYNNQRACLKGCDEFNERCTSRQDVADECATAFKSCMRGAQVEIDRDGCRMMYTRCKKEGDGKRNRDRD